MRWFHPLQFAIRAINNPVENSKDFHRRSKYAERFEDAFNSVKYILVPILEKKHWFLAYIDIDEKKVEIWDSLRSKQSKREREYVVLRVLQALEIVHEDNKIAWWKTGVNFVDFKLCHPKCVPQQRNGFDCGIYVIKFMELLDGPTNLTQVEVNPVDDRLNCLLQIVGSKVNNQVFQLREASRKHDISKKIADKDAAEISKILKNTTTKGRRGRPCKNPDQ